MGGGRLFFDAEQDLVAITAENSLAGWVREANLNLLSS